MEKEGNGIAFRDVEILRYSGLYAYDATGKKLDARMSADKEGIRLLVADHEAVYPVIIDPFIETKKLLASNGVSGDSFGMSVSINGDIVIVNAYEDDNSTGSAYIFSRDQGGADTWGQFQKLTAGDGEIYDYFGYFGVSISGGTIIVVAHRNDDTGSAYMYLFQQDTDAMPWVPLLLLND